MKNLLSVTKIISHTSVGRRIKATHHHRIHYFIQWAVSLNDVCMVLQWYCHINLCFIKPQRLLQIQIHRSSINQDWSWRLYISVGNQPFYLQASFYYSNVFTVLIQLGTAASLLPLACHCRYKLYKLEIICHVYSKRQLFDFVYASGWFCLSHLDYKGALWRGAKVMFIFSLSKKKKKNTHTHYEVLNAILFLITLKHALSIEYCGNEP